MQSPNTRKRLNLDLSPEAYKLLKQLSSNTGKDMADVLRTGLALYGIAAEENQRGKQLAVTDGTLVERTIVLSS